MRGLDHSVPVRRSRATPDSADRRDARRFEILGRLHGHVVTLDLDVELREISLGGLSMDSALLFPVGAIHEFRVSMGDGTPVVLRGEIVHSQPSSSGTLRRYVTGVRFLDDDPDSPVGDLIDHLG